MGQFGAGQGLRRVEDRRLLTGEGRYNDDINQSDQAVMVLVRSPYAHAEILAIDAIEALAAPGVVAVYSAQDLQAEGIGDIPCVAPVPGKAGGETIQPPHPVLARDRVRHVGDPVAAVVAESLSQARDAAELVMVDYEELPSNTDLAAAHAPGTPLIWDQAPGNLSVDYELGDQTATDAAFAEAATISRIDLVNNRVIVCSMEPRGAIGDYDGETERFTLTTGSQGVFKLRNQLANNIFNLPQDRFRVITPDVGGGFGMKNFLYGEQVLVLFAARRLGRPVKWSSDRSEAFLSDTHGRDQLTAAELALDADGQILAIRIKSLANMGAYLSNFGPVIPTVLVARMLSGVYRIPAAYAEVKCLFTNTVPVDAYRGAGRPEGAYIVERLIDRAARDLGLTPDAFRRRNFVRPQELPYATATGLTYDSGDFERLLDRALEAADWAGFEARRQEAGGRGQLRGLGLAYYVEACAGVDQEEARLRLDEDGGITVFVGTVTNGQGHATAYAQLLNDQLGLPPELMRLRQGDSDEITYGYGTGGSRSLLMGGVAIQRAADKVLDKARRIAGHLLEASVEDLEFADMTFTIVGTDRRVTFAQVAQAAQDPAATGLPAELGGPIDETDRYQAEALTYPNGCHLCELEIDPETGVVELLRYLVVDDFGRVVNPLLVAGQVHGGVAQGIGQALYEHTVYEAESGQLLTGSLMDYCLPRAGGLPSIELDLVQDMPCTTNPLGVKGAGEAGTIGAAPAVMNGLMDALSPLGIKTIDMPATPERVWRLIQDARSAQAAE
jgi:carbon-monoxide dehydrogenase large subunit